MRTASAGCILLVLCLAADAQTPPAKDVRVVKLAKAEVYSGPSLKATFYVTNRLNKGDAVEVVETLEQGWLKIRPPAGSTSLINKNFLEEIAPGKSIKVVALENSDAPIFASPADSTRQRPNVISVKLKRGHQVMTRRVIHDDDGVWMEIDSPPTEWRYIRAEAVEQGGSSDPARAAVTTGSAGGLTPSTAPSANITSTAEDLRRQAVLADNSGNTAEAIRLYDRISTQFATSYPRLVAASRARAAYLRGEYPAPRGGVSDGEARGPSTPPVRVGTRQDGMSSTFIPSDRTESTTVRGGEPDRTPGARSFRGRLVVAGRGIDGKRAYQLVASYYGSRNPLTYAIAGPGIDLDGYVNRGEVEIHGTGQYSDEVKANVMQVTRIIPLD